MNQTRMLTTLREDGVNTVFFAEGPFGTDELDRKAILLSQPFGIGTQFITKRLGKLGIVKNADIMGEKIARHPIGIIKTGKSTHNHNAIKARKDAVDQVGITLKQ